MSRGRFTTLTFRRPEARLAFAIVGVRTVRRPPVLAGRRLAATGLGLEGREGMTLEFSMVGRGFEGEGEFCERVPPREIAQYGNSKKSLL